jgi:hypothetical protein
MGGRGVLFFSFASYFESPITQRPPCMFLPSQAKLTSWRILLARLSLLVGLALTCLRSLRTLCSTTLGSSIALILLLITVRDREAGILISISRARALVVLDSAAALERGANVDVGGTVDGKGALGVT